MSEHHEEEEEEYKMPPMVDLSNGRAQQKQEEADNLEEGEHIIGSYDQVRIWI